MLRNFAKFLALLVLANLLGSVGAMATVSAQDGGTVDFVTQIKPIFENHCIACHGPTEEEDFRIDDSVQALNYVIPEDSESSDMYLYLVSEEESEKMPPDDAHVALTAKQISLVKTWIDEGAEWPEDAGEFQDIPLPDAVADAEKEEAKQQQALNAVGSLHPAAVHLPIGLLLAAGLFAFLSLRGNFVMSDCAYYCLWLGTLGAIVACATGWFYAPMERYGVQALDGSLLDQEDPLFWHRTSAVVATAFALILSLFAASARNRDPDDGLMWKLGLIVLACGIGWVGHEGGELTYGKDHYKDLNAVFNSFFEGGDVGENEEKGNDVDEDGTAGEDASDAESEDEVGTTSEETT